MISFFNAKIASTGLKTRRGKTWEILSPPVLTFSIGEVAYTEDVVGVGVVVLLDVGRFLRRVLQLHGHLLQLLVQLRLDQQESERQDQDPGSHKYI